MNEKKSRSKSHARVVTEKGRAAAELRIATQIQIAMLPHVFPAFPDRSEFEIFASIHAAKEISGDFYDFFLIGNTHLAVVIGEISGKGVPAALFMVDAMTLFKTYAQLELSPKEVCEIVNNRLCEQNDRGLLVTALMGVMEIETGRFTYVNAGHVPPLISRGETYEWLELKPGSAMAATENITYTQDEVFLFPNDRLFLYTNGVTDAQNPAKELYSASRLLDFFNSESLEGKDVEEILSLIGKSIADFVDGEEQMDDITMLLLKINEKGTVGF